jgi:hypothetical protein
MEGDPAFWRRQGQSVTKIGNLHFVMSHLHRAANAAIMTAR